MRKAVECAAGGGVSVVAELWLDDLNRAFRMVWGSTSAELERGVDRDAAEDGVSFFPGVSLSLLEKEIISDP